MKFSKEECVAIARELRTYNPLESEIHANSFDDYTQAVGVAADIIDDQQETITNLKIMLDTLPKTADKVPVVPGMDVWHPKWGKSYSTLLWLGCMCSATFPCKDAMYCTVAIDECFYTEEAAIAARDSTKPSQTFYGIAEREFLEQFGVTNIMFDHLRPMSLYEQAIMHCFITQQTGLAAEKLRVIANIIMTNDEDWRRRALDIIELIKE